ncbi:hypothetical protein V8B55DRAFT_1453987 [Mucor lusitanicus]
MSDNYHLSSNENQHPHPQEFYPLLAQPSTESPSTTASPISPMVTIAPQNQSWPSMGQAIDQRHYYHDMNQHPQHQLQDQYWPNAYQPDPSYPHYNQPQLQQQRFQQYYPEPTYVSPPPPALHHHHPSSVERSVPTFYTTQQQPMDNSFNAPMSNIESTFSGPSSAIAAPSIDRMHNNKEKSGPSQEHSTERLTVSPSSFETPMPSPVISGKRKRRGSAATTSQGGSHGSHDEGDADSSGVTTTRRVDATKDTHHSNQTVDQLENELAFLRDECATILIMLDSLRNAFLADIPSNTTTTSASAARSNSSSATINFMIENVGAFSPTTTPSMQRPVDTSSATTNNGDKRRRSKAMAQNAEMEREMRFAYDDLMLQVRQLEKKVERLEGKSKHQKKHEDQTAHSEDDMHELLQQEDTTSNDNGVDKTDGDGDSGGEEDSSTPKGK